MNIVVVGATGLIGNARYFGSALEPRTLVAGDDAARGRLRFAAWPPGR